MYLVDHRVLPGIMLVLEIQVVGSEIGHSCPISCLSRAPPGLMLLLMLPLMWPMTLPVASRLYVLRPTEPREQLLFHGLQKASVV